MVTKPAAPSARTIPSNYDSFGDYYPSEDGEPIADNDFQYIAITDTVAALRARFAHRLDVYVAGAMLVYYRQGDSGTRVAPDVYVVFDAKGNHSRMSWLIWDEGKAPDFVMEVGAASTWRRDAGEKREIYAAMGVGEYWRFDPTGGDLFSPVLIGERLVDGRYLPLDVAVDESGILRGYSPILGLDLCVLADSKLHLYDPAAGEWLLNPAEQAVALRERDIALREKAAALREQTAALRQRDTALREQTVALRESEAKLAEAQAELERLRAQQ